jgi:hypothetical protein
VSVLVLELLSELAVVGDSAVQPTINKNEINRRVNFTEVPIFPPLFIYGD